METYPQQNYFSDHKTTKTAHQKIYAFIKYFHVSDNVTIMTKASESVKQKEKQTPKPKKLKK